MQSIAIVQMMPEDDGACLNVLHFEPVPGGYECNICQSENTQAVVLSSLLRKHTALQSILCKLNAAVLHSIREWRRWDVKSFQSYYYYYNNDNNDY